MKKASTCRKPSKKASLKQQLKFRNKMDELNFNKVPFKEIVMDIVGKELKKPKRATLENALQAQYKYLSTTEYSVVILTGMIDGVLNPKGSAWVHIINEKTDKKVWTREFYKKNPEDLIDRLCVYAHFAKNISDCRPSNADLVEVTETEYEWKAKRGKHVDPFDIADHLYDLSEEEKGFILANEKKRDNYLKRTEDEVTRQRTFQKKWN